MCLVFAYYSFVFLISRFCELPQVAKLSLACRAGSNKLKLLTNALYYNHSSSDSSTQWRTPRDVFKGGGSALYYAAPSLLTLLLSD